MTQRSELTERVDVDAPQWVVWSAITDWSRQGAWMLGTDVRVTEGDGESAGSRLAAFTGVGPLGFTDYMEITSWDPPRRCEVSHTGRVVRGSGVFEVRPRGDKRSTLVWTEYLDLPLDELGRAGWVLLRPAFAAGVRYSLRRFADFAAKYPR